MALRIGVWPRRIASSISNTGAMTAQRHTILLLIEDPDLSEDCAHIAAAAGYSTTRAEPDTPSQLDWRHANAVLVDPGALALLPRATLPRRDRVWLVHGVTQEPDWPAAMRLGCAGGWVLPTEAGDLVEQLGRPGAVALGDGHIIGVSPGSGGVGASTLACAVAAAVPGQRLLIEADWLGPGLDLVLGAEQQPGLRWADLSLTGGHIDAEDVLAAVPQSAGGLPVLATGRTRQQAPTRIEPAALDTVASSVAAAGAVAVIDFPRGGQLGMSTGAEHGVANGAGLDCLRSSSLHAVVVQATVAGVAAAANAASALRAAGADPVAVLRGPAPSGINWADIEAATGMVVIADLPTVRGLANKSELDGLEPTTKGLSRVAEVLLTEAGVA